VYRLGAGRFVLDNLLIRENLGRVPAAKRLLRNADSNGSRKTTNSKNHSSSP
jgi:hypothetical protein